MTKGTSCLVVRNTCRNADKPVCGMQAGRSVGAKCDIAIDDAVTHADVLDVFANGFDYPGGLVADDRWKGRDRKSTSTIINVDEVETYDGVADQCLIAPGPPPEHFPDPQ